MKNVTKQQETAFPDLTSIPEKTAFNLSDFALFLSVMKNRTAYECTLSIITNDPGLKLKEVHVEQVILNKLGKRAIRLDAWALDTENRQYNMEMQNDTDNDDIRKRSPYYQGLIDSPILKSGKQTRYRNLPATMIIFITQDDIFGKDSAIYTFSEQCNEFPGMKLKDGTTKVFLNMTSKNGTPELVSLLQYMKDSRLDNPNIVTKDERILKLAEIVEEVKQSEDWEGIKMSILSVGIERGKEIGIQQGKIEAILDFLNDLGAVPDDVVRKLQKESDPTRLSQLLKKAAKAESMEEFALFYKNL